MPMHANGYVNNIYFQLPIPKNKICLHTGRRITLDVNIRKKKRVIAARAAAFIYWFENETILARWPPFESNE